ncbi:MAG: ribonuclease H-like domain-containing protein [Methanobacteriaceae archaeon]|nr:ribonuclease H-like domain-containing protein [Methanobacteriaceae archaeon]
MKILAFSDWRTQDFLPIFHTLKNLEEKPDFIVYCGDDIEVFEDWSLENMVKRLTCMGFQNINFEGLNVESRAVFLDLKDYYNNYLIMVPVNDYGIENAKKAIINSLVYYKNLLNDFDENISLNSELKNLIINNINIFNSILYYNLNYEDYNGNWPEKIIDNFNLKILKIGSRIFAILNDLDFESEKIFDKLSNYSKKGVLAVLGNDDYPEYKCILRTNNVVNLHEENVINDNFCFIGLEGGKEETNQLIGNILYSESQIESYITSKSKEVNENIILISHMPPYKILDLAVRFGAENIGSKSIKNFIKNKNVILNLCGHVHLLGGHSQIYDGCLVVNVASTESDIYGNAALIDIDVNTNDISLEWLDLRKYNLMQLYQVGPTREDELRDMGVLSIDDLLKCKPSKLSQKFGKALTKRWMSHAKAIKSKKAFLMQNLEIPENIIFYDIETTISDKIPWLIGVYDSCNDDFVQFFARNSSEEWEMIQNFWNYISKDESKVLCSYSGSFFDKRILLSRMEQFDEAMADSFDKRTQIDLCKELRKSLVLPTLGYSLDELSDYFGFKVKHDSLDGLMVGIQYEEYLNGGKEPNWDQLFEYNEDDVKAIPFIINEILKLE